MHIAFLNPQGNFDPQDRYWTEHPDFGGQLVYVKEVALALGELGHRVDILTRRIQDPDWPGFEEPFDSYSESDRVRIVRLECGGPQFLAKEQLWPHLIREWVPNIRSHYLQEGAAPEAATTHYADGGLAGAVWQAHGGPPFTFTGHSLGAQKLDRLLGAGAGSLAELDERFLFRRRLAAERLAMNHAAQIITSTSQERREQYAHAAYAGAIDPGNDDHFSIIPPGVNLRLFNPEPVDAIDGRVADHLQRVLTRDLDPDRLNLPAVLSSSRLDRKKNVSGLVRAFAQSEELQRRANLLLVLRGQVDLRSRIALGEDESNILDEIVSICDQANLWGKVSGFSLTSQQQLAAAYRILSRQKSIFALAALYEPFGLAPLEAMACGLPAVVTNQGGPTESMVDGGTEYGVLIDPESPSSIAGGILRLLQSSSWREFQQRGRQRVFDRYTWDQTAAAYAGVLANIIGFQPGGSALEIHPYFVDPRPQSDLDESFINAIWSDYA